MLLPLRVQKKKRGRVHYRYSLDETCVCNGPLQEVAQYDAVARREREGFNPRVCGSHVGYRLATRASLTIEIQR